MDLTSIIKQHAAPLLSNIDGLAKEKQNDVLQSMTNSISTGFKSEMSKGSGLQALTSLLTKPDSIAGNPITQGIQNNFLTDLVGRLGLNSTVANSIVAILPMVLGAITRGKSGSSLDIGSLLGGLSTNQSGTSGVVGNILKGKAKGLLGGLLGD